MSTIDVQTRTDVLPPFQLIKGIDLGYNDDYVFDVTANSQFAMTSASDNLVRLYDLGTLQLAYTIPAHKNRISKMKLKSDQYLFTASEDCSLNRWDLRAHGATGPVQTFKCKINTNMWCYISKILTFFFCFFCLLIQILSL
jgi:WD40 repeat protein